MLPDINAALAYTLRKQNHNKIFVKFPGPQIDMKPMGLKKTNKASIKKVFKTSKNHWSILLARASNADQIIGKILIQEAWWYF